MAWPIGVRRGPMSSDHRAKIAAGNIEGQQRRWADPEKRERAIAGCRASWKSGGRAKDRVIWTPEMDDLLRRLYYQYGFAFVRTEGARRIGVSERTLRARLRFLGVAGKGELICDNWEGVVNGAA